MMHLPNRQSLLAAAAVVTALPLLGVAGWASSSASTGSVAVSAAPPPVVIELLSRGTVAKPFKAESKGIELETRRPIDVVNVRLTFAPGTTIDWHKHPGPVVVTVTSGTLTFIDDQCTRQRYGPGETFVEDPTERAGKARNAGSTDAQTIVSFYVPVGTEALTIPVAPPACAR